MPRDYHIYLKSIRLALGLTLKKAAKYIHYSNTTISLYENNLFKDRLVYDMQVQNLIEREYQNVIQSRCGNKGAWYRYYIELKAALIEIQLYEEAGIKLPESLFDEVKAKSAAFSKCNLRKRRVSKKDGDPK